MEHLVDVFAALVLSQQLLKLEGTKQERGKCKRYVTVLFSRTLGELLESEQLLRQPCRTEVLFLPATS